MMTEDDRLKADRSIEIARRKEAERHKEEPHTAWIGIPANIWKDLSAERQTKIFAYADEAHAHHGKVAVRVAPSNIPQIVAWVDELHGREKLEQREKETVRGPRVKLS